MTTKIMILDINRDRSKAIKVNRKRNNKRMFLKNFSKINYNKKM